MNVVVFMGAEWIGDCGSLAGQGGLSVVLQFMIE